MSIIQITSQHQPHNTHVASRPGDSRRDFFKRTLAAQMHAIACVLCIIASVILLRLAASAPLADYISIAVFSLSAVLLFAASAFQHFLDDGFHISKRLLLWLENIDKFGVYLLIAGTYTAVLTHALADSSGNWLLALVWLLAIGGCLYTIFIERLPLWAQSRVVYTGQFVLLGWMALLRIVDLFHALSVSQLIFFISGGASYTIGAAAYALKRPNLHSYFGYHELWHLCVMIGCAFFYALIASFYITFT